MAKTLAQKQADKQLHEALMRNIEAYNLLPDGYHMIDHVTIIEGVNLTDEDADDSPKESLGLAFRDGRIRTSVAKGLVQMAFEALQANYAREENE